MGTVFACGGCPAEQVAWRDTFPVDKASLTATGANTFFTLAPGAQSRFTDGEVVLTITVLNETQVVDGVTTRVIEEREEIGGQPLEVSRNYFAIDPATGDVYYFGEDVDIYENGQLANHEGAWLSGVEGARFGLFMPGTIEIGDRFYQEVAPGVAEDRAEIVATDATVNTPAGTFQNCLHIRETSPLESGQSQKWFAPDVGLVQDDEFVLTEFSRP
jgi:hypothetical protein